jgi:hypothetical protein
VNALDRHFFDPAFTGHDWKALRARFRPYAAGRARRTSCGGSST